LQNSGEGQKTLLQQCDKPTFPVWYLIQTKKEKLAQESGSSTPLRDRELDQAIHLTA